MRPLAFAVPSALAACFAVASLSLTGCTIYTYDHVPPKSKPSKTRRPTSSSTSTRTPSNQPVVRRPGTTTNSGATRTPSGRVPTVKGTTIFGGNAAAAFKGEAFVIPEGTKAMPSFDDLVPFALLYTDQFNVSPQEFSGGFPGALLQDEWFGIRYVGKIAIPARGKVTFKLVSDDGAILYIDDAKVIDNDGVHTAKTVTGDATLDAGQHAVRLEYFQEKKGTVALQLFLVAAGQDIPVIGVR